MRRIRSLLAVVTLAGLVLTACGSSGKKASTASTSTTANQPLTASFRGVTANSIKVGMPFIDWDCIKQFVDYNFGNQQLVKQTFVDDINKHGGILGRQIVPVFKSICPIAPGPSLDACTSFTEDSQVFAVMGVFAPTFPDVQLCLARDHKTIFIGHEFEQSTIAQAPPGLLLTPDTTTERRTSILLNLLKRQGTLSGRTVAVLADQDSKASVDSVLTPGLADMHVKQGSTAVLTISGTDTSAAQSQLDSFIEKWKTEHVDTVFLAGNNVGSKQFVDKIKKALPSALLLADSEANTKSQGQDEVTNHVTPNSYAGAMTASGLTDEETFDTPSVKQCVQTFQTATGQTVLSPDQVTPGPDGHRVELYQAIEDTCDELNLFKQIATKAGANLTNDTWSAAVNNFGEIQLIGNQYGSLHQGKYDADDAFRLVSFDPTLGSKGDWKSLTPIEDASH